MADETTKTASTPKSETPKSETKTASVASDAAPTNYSRGEGQKLVTQAYRDNWLAIFGKPTRKRAARPKGAAKARPAKNGAKPKKAARKTRSRRGR